MDKKLSIAFLSDKRKMINYSLVFFQTGYSVVVWNTCVQKETFDKMIPLK